MLNESIELEMPQFQSLAWRHASTCHMQGLVKHGHHSTCQCCVGAEHSDGTAAYEDFCLITAQDTPWRQFRTPCTSRSMLCLQRERHDHVDGALHYIGQLSRHSNVSLAANDPNAHFAKNSKADPMISTHCAC